MNAKEHILELGASRGIETPHVAHVARLAMDLFDGFSPILGLRREDRNLLFAAACLHDIGYAEDPENHVEKGVSILLENPLSCFAPKEWKAIVAMVRLHQRDWRTPLQSEYFARFSHRRIERIKRLAALLRIADGLDHSHIQDARVLSCRPGEKADKVIVECRWYPGNTTWAEQKADLWEAVTKRPLRFKTRLTRGTKPFGGVVSGKDSAVSAARKILYSQYDIMRDHVPGMLEGDDPEYLHHYRVAMRRFRTALRFFKPLLNETGAAVLDRSLAELGAMLSPIRDIHVRAALFHELEAEQEAANRRLADILVSDKCQNAVKEMLRLLRVELPALERSGPTVGFRAYARKRLQRTLARIRTIEVTPYSGDLERLHAARKIFRRGRYMAEFTAPVLGLEIHRTARHLKTIATALGDIRDARVLATWPECPPDVAAELERRQAEGWASYDKGRRKLTKN